MPKIKLVTNVSEHGLIRPFAVTRARLIGSTATITALGVASGVGSAQWILNSSDSVVLNLLLITINMMFLIAAAYFQAVLVGDLFFSSSWREQVILGRSTGDNVTVKDHNAEFLICFLIALFANTLIVNYAAGDFFDTYHNETFFEVKLRSEDPEERKDAFVDLKDPMNYKLWDRQGIQDLAVQHIDDPVDEVAIEAIYHVGNMKVESAREKLATVVQDSDRSEAVRDEAAYAMAQLGNLGDSRKVLESIALSDSPTGVRIAALRGLAVLGSPLSSPAIAPLIEDPDLQVRLFAYWVLREAGDSDVREALFERLDDTIEKQERCAIFDTLKMVANEDDLLWARKTYRTQEADVTCDPIIWEDRGERQYYVTYSDSMRVKIMKIVANVDGHGAIGWFERLVADPQEEVRVREVANEILRRFKGSGY